MPKYIAFLRAINVGAHTVKMDHLRRLFEEIGFTNVETFIASGNVIFQSRSGNSRSLEQKIEQHLKAALGYAVATFIRSPAELNVIARCAPVGGSSAIADGTVLYIGFLAATPGEEAVRKLVSFNSDTDEFFVAGREVYWLCRTTVSKSTFSGASMEKTLGMAATLRNVTTVRRLAAKS